MRKRTLAVVVGLLALGLLLIWMLRERHQPEVGRSTPEASGTPDQNVGSEPRPNRQQAGRPQVPQVPDLQAAHSAAATQAALAFLSNTVQPYWDQVHRPIEFYGRVVDENGKPVEGASIGFSWTFYHPEGSFTTNALSDGNGLFALKGVVGAELFVSVSKPGYYNVKSLNQNNSFGYSTSLGSEPFKPSPSDPVIFHLRRKGSGVDLITSQHGIFPELEFSVPRDGTTIRVDFFGQKVASQGQLEVSSVKPPRGQVASEWSFRLSIPDGGFVEENDEFPFEAPESGYQTTLEFHFQAGETNWTDTLRRSYYIVFGQPPKYGRIDVETGAYMGVDLGYAINPDGTRNLEPKESMPFHQEPPPGVTEVIPPDRLK